MGDRYSNSVTIHQADAAAHFRRPGFHPISMSRSICSFGLPNNRLIGYQHMDLGLGIRLGRQEIHLVQR